MSIENKALTELNALLDDLCTLGNDAKTSEDIQPIMSALHNVTGLHFSIGTLIPTQIDASAIIADFLTLVNPPELSELSNICILRTLFAYNTTPEWQSLKVKVKEHF